MDYDTRTQDLIKQDLVLALQESNIDYSKIIALSNELSACDNNHVRFSVDAGIINRLGNELVAKRETAVGELIKNAYDADATNVELIFVQSLLKGGTLLVKDNGSGMTREQLVNGFMRLSSTEKVTNPISLLYKRGRAGQKGIGRFAAQRLGEKLTIITQTEASDMALKVVLDWNAFGQQKDLWSIESEITEIPKQKTKGTDLIIENLREGWSDAWLKRIYNSIQILLQPFPLDQNPKSDIDPGFNINIYREEISEDTKFIGGIDAIYDLALAEINAEVGADQIGRWSMSSSRLNVNEAFSSIDTEKKTLYPHLQGVHIRAYYYIYDSALFPPRSMKYYQTMAREYGGIRVYKNGFRVLPYGTRDNDWLGLDESVTQRTILAPHQNLNFFGFVEIQGSLLNQFEETASREGLIENEAYQELTEFVYSVLTSVAMRIASIRGKKGRAAQKDWNQNPSLKVDDAIEELRSAIENEYSNNQNEEESATDNKNDKRSEGRKRFYRQAKDLIDELKHKRQEERKAVNDLINELNMLRVLAGMGLVMGVFIHEIKRFLPAFREILDNLKSILHNNPTANKNLDELHSNLAGFASYTSYFESSISQNVVRQLEPIALHAVVRNFCTVIEADVKRGGINMVSPELEGIYLRTIPMHKSEWTSILFNLYTNAKKAINKANTKDRRILIFVGEDQNMAIVRFSDTGIGIPDNAKERIFDAFYTTSVPVKENDNNGMEGSGLGLKIVKDIVESYGGNIAVISPMSTYKTTIQILIPKLV